MRISWWEIGFENVSELEESGKTKCRLLHNSCDSSILGFIYWMPLSYFVRRNRVFEPIQIYTRRDIKQYKRNTAKERVYQINCIVTYFWKKNLFGIFCRQSQKKSKSISYNNSDCDKIHTLNLSRNVSVCPRKDTNFIQFSKLR